MDSNTRLVLNVLDPGGSSVKNYGRCEVFLLIVNSEFVECCPNGVVLLFFGVCL
jgi:hypothetical protein